jgi:hypothetical protein
VSNFTDAELGSAVSRFVRSELKIERDQLGPLNVDQTFLEVRELVASTLVFDPSAVFYLLSLAANRINQDVLQALDYVSDLRTAISEVGRYTTKVTKTSLLADASVALAEADRQIKESNALTARPLSRYNKAIDEFSAASLSPNIRRPTGLGFPNTYEIVRPPQKAQAAIRTDVDSLRGLHQSIINEANKLLESMSEFMEANLPLTAIQSSVSKVRADLDTLKNELDAATSDEAVAMTKDAFLSIEAGRAVIDNLSSINDPREARMNGTESTSDRARSAYLMGYSSSTPAHVETGISAPWPIAVGDNDELQLEVDGAATISLQLVPPAPAEIYGARGESFDIHEQQTAFLLSSLMGDYTVPVAPNNEFSIIVDGVEYTVTIAPGVWTASNLASSINLATRADGQPGELWQVALASGATGYLRFDHVTPGAVHDIVIGEETTFNAAVGFTDGQDSDDQWDTRGVEANNIIRFFANDKDVVEISLTIGQSRTAAQVASDILLGGGGYIEGDTAAVGSDIVVVVRSTQYGGGSMVQTDPTTPTHRLSMAALGFFEGQSDRSSDFGLEDLFDLIDTTSELTVERSQEIIAGGEDGEVLMPGTDPIFRVPAGKLTGVTTQHKLHIIGGDNAGYYGVQAVSSGTYDEIVSDRYFPAMTGDQAQNLSWEIVDDTLIISSATVDKTSALEVQTPTHPANTVLGLPVGLVYGTVSGVEVSDAGDDQSFSRNDVRVGDKLEFFGPTYFTEHTVTALTNGGYQIEVTPEVPNDLVAHLYSIISGAGIEYDEFIGELDNWLSNELVESRFADGIQELERLINPLLANRHPSRVRINDADSAAAELESLYSSLSVILADFVVTPAVTRIDALLNMLRERGLERAHDLLLLGEFEQFFALSKDAASYGGNFLENMRLIAQNDMPQGRTEDEDHTDSRLTSSFTEIDADYDFSDADVEDGLTLIDDIPDVYEEEDFLDETY